MWEWRCPQTSFGLSEVEGHAPNAPNYRVKTSVMIERGGATVESTASA